jgi:hypothetical protein
MLDICKQFGKEFTNEQENMPRRGVAPHFSDLEVIALSLTTEALSIDSENLLFIKLTTDYKADFFIFLRRYLKTTKDTKRQGARGQIVCKNQHQILHTI